MTRRDPDTAYDTLPQALRFVCDQLCRSLRTAVPGIVAAYRPDTMRATVQPAVRLDGADPDPRAPLLDVPVLWPGNSRWAVHAPLAPGDTVLVVFCERDIAAFKQTLREGPPPTGRALSANDSVAVPTLSAEPDGGPPPDGAIAVTSADGATSITLTDGLISLRADAIEFRYIDGADGEQTRRWGTAA